MVLVVAAVEFASPERGASDIATLAGEEVARL
jgi:hypothetical protein